MLVRIQLFILIASSLAQASSTHPLTKTELTNILKLYNNTKTLSSHFKQVKRISDLNVSIESIGDLEVIYPNTVRWTITKPSYFQAVIQNGVLTLGTQNSQAKDGQKKEVARVDSPSLTKNLATLLMWLRLDIDSLYSSYFFYKQQTGKYTCTPKKQTNDIFNKMSFKIDPSGFLSELTLNEVSGDIMEIYFSSPNLSR